MSKTGYAKCSIFLNIALLTIFVNLCASAPLNVTENTYTHFIAELNRDKCSVPSQVQLPFDATKVNNFEYLSSYLEICQKTESAKHSKEAVILCNEIFNSLRNISCSKQKTALPDISVKLSQKVCEDFGTLKDSVPDDEKTLLKRLTDSVVCDIMCDGEFEKACQVLLWSFEVQKFISSVKSSQGPEQPIVLEDGVENNDNFKEEIIANEDSSVPTINSQKGQQKTEETKDISEALAHNGIDETPVPLKTEDNPEQKPDETANTVEKDSQEKNVSSNKLVSENQLVQKIESQSLTDTSKSSNNMKTSSTPSQPTSITSISKTDITPKGEATKNENNGQNANNGMLDKVADNHAGDSVPKGLIANVATDEQTQSADADDQLHSKDNDMPHDKQLQVNSNNEDNPKETTDETPEKADLAPHILGNNEFPHESGNEMRPNDVAADFYGDAHNPSNNVDALAQNKVQGKDEEMSRKTDTSSTVNNINKDTAQQQVVQEVTAAKTGQAADENNADHSQTNLVLPKVKTQDQAKSDAITHGLVSDDKTTNILPIQKQTKVSPETEKIDNTIPDTTGTSDKEKLPEINQKSKATDANPSAKSIMPTSVTQSSTKSSVALEKMESDSDFRQPIDEEGDHYGDLENTEDDYSRPEYEGGLYEGSKTKESNPDIPSPVVISKEKIPIPNEKPMEFHRNSFGQDSSDMMIGFPEQEDSHFFFYFLSIVLILMAGYLIFHNKQKIIALIVEGRHERNRRSHRVGYKKLETK